MKDTYDIRTIMLQVIHDQQPKGPTDRQLQQGSVLEETKRRLGVTYDLTKEQAILTTWHDLFRTGYLAWGLNITNPNSPFFHVSESGRRALASLSRDPGNPAGYLRHLAAIATLNPIGYSYLKEGLECYMAGLYKAAAVMVGGATENIILELRDVTVQKLISLGKPIPKKMNDWKIKTVSDTLYNFLDGYKSQFVPELRDEFEAYWTAFAQQIRAVRNDAGHPTSVDPVTPDTVYASLLIFPELAKLADKLRTWVTNDFI
ncbi:MAG: hypothetical protein M1147_11395 [Nitrospirae bacterium]|nr:hypothetical protein [Nitrospirota bacterium]